MTNRLTPATLAVALAAAVALVAAADPARAQQVRLYGADEAIDPREVAAILGAPQAARAPKFRGLRLLDDDAPAQQAIQSAGAEAQAAPALALPVQFGFDSAAIEPAARRQLDALAQGIRLLPPDRSVVIEGHTDALGGDDYNERLSQRRAQAVRQYLVAQHGISASRLQAVGRGEHAPLPGHEPGAPENRRVQFRGE